MHEKRAGIVIFEEVDLTQEQFDQPIFWLLAALLVFMPAALGSWDPTSELIALAGASLLAIMLAFKLVRRRDIPFIWSWTYLPIALFLIYGLFQLLPLPAAWVGAISPKTKETNYALLGDLPHAAERLRYLHLNFYPEEAWHDLRKIVAVAFIFVVVVNVFRRAQQMTRLLWLIAIIGTAEGALSIAQNLTGAHQFYWLIPVAWGDASGGSFPNHNCFSQFMNLSSGAMIGLLLLKIDQTFRRRDYSAPEMLEKFNSLDFRPAWLLLLMLAVSISSVFLSLSRGGMISIAVAGIVVSILLVMRGGARGMGVGGWFAGVILVAVFAIIMASGKNLVEARIARIGNSEDRYDRFQLTKDTFQAWKDYPSVGMGLGSFVLTFPSYDHSNTLAVASHAEDEYVELLQETGIVGAAIAGAFMLMIALSFMQTRARAKKNRNDDRENELDQEQASQPEPATPPTEHSSHRRRSGHRHHHGKKTAPSPASSLALGLCFGLVAILVQSATDFGQHSIAVASVTAIFCALMVNLAKLRRRERGIDPEPAPARGWVGARIAAIVGVLLISIPLLLQANSVRMGTTAFENESTLASQLASQDWKSEPGQVTDLMRFADESVQDRPHNLLFHYWRDINCFYTISDVRDPSTGDVILNDEKMNTLKGIASDLQNSRWLCPLYGPLYCQLGQWDRNSLDHPAEGAKYIRLGYELAPGDPVCCYVMGLLQAEEGQWADSIKYFRRSALLESARLQDAVYLYIHYFHRPDMAVTLAGDDVEELGTVATAIRALGKDPAPGPTTGPATQSADEAIARQAEQHADDLTRAAADRPDASPKTLAGRGMLCFKNRDFPDAARYLGRALKFDYGEVDWRLAYAQSLAETGQKDEAMRQAQIILRERPQMPEAQSLEELLNRPTTRALDEMLR